MLHILRLPTLTLRLNFFFFFFYFSVLFDDAIY